MLKRRHVLWSLAATPFSLAVVATARPAPQPPGGEPQRPDPPRGRRRQREGGAARRGQEGGGDARQTEAQATEEGLPGDVAARRRWWVEPKWRLGVRAYNTPQGVYITDVEPNTPAHRFGLERRDVIVTVDGFQVGWVGDLAYYLGQELQLRAGPRGEVRLLVHNHRDNQLVNVDVRLERSGAPRRRDRERPAGRDVDPGDRDALRRKPGNED